MGMKKFLVVLFIIFSIIFASQQVYATKDPFGITELYPTGYNGWVWNATWDNRAPITLNSGSFDPIDPEFKATGNGQFHINGNGTAYENGTAPRIYIADWPHNFAKQWHSVEATFYFELVKATSSAQSSDGAKIGFLSGSHSATYPDECIDVGTVAPISNPNSAYNYRFLEDGRADLYFENLYHIADKTPALSGPSVRPVTVAAFTDFTNPIVAMNDTNNVSGALMYGTSGTSTYTELASAGSTLIGKSIDKIEVQMHGSDPSRKLYSGNVIIMGENATSNSVMVGQSIDTIKVQLRKLGSPTGSYTVGVFFSNGTLKTSFGTGLGSALTTTFTYYTYTHAAYTIVANDVIGIKYNDAGSDSSNTVKVMQDTHNTFDNLNSTLVYYDSSWHPTNAMDMNMILTGTSGGTTITVMDDEENAANLTGNIVAGIFTSPETTYMSDATQSGGLTVYDTTTRHIIAEHVNATSILVGKTINTFDIVIRKGGSPTGNYTLGIFDGAGNLVTFFANDTVSSLDGATYATKSYTFSNYTILSGDNIGIRFTGGDASNNLVVNRDTTNGFDGKNSVKASYATSWTYQTTEDVTMSLLYNPPGITDPILAKSFGTLAVSNVTSTSYKNFQFQLTTGNYTIKQGDRIGVQYTSGDANNNLAIMRDTANTFDGTNSILSTYVSNSGGWTDASGLDMYMVLTSGGDLTPISATTGYHIMPNNKWIGMKVVAQILTNGTVHTAMYQDTTNGANGGNWRLIMQYNDHNQWIVDKFLTGWNAGNYPCYSTAPLNLTLNRQMPMMYFRSDHIDQMNYKFASIRELANGTLPDAPANLSAVAGKNNITLSWSAASNGGAPVTNYTLWRSVTTNTETAYKILTNVTSYTDISLGNGQKYYYKVTAVNAWGNSTFSNEASATTFNVPNAPQNLQATKHNTYIILNWQVPSSNGGTAINHYTILRSLASGTETPLFVLGNVTTYNNTGLTNGVAYYYKVQAGNIVGNSTSSNEATATPDAGAASAPSAPQSLTGTAGLSQVDISWLGPISNGGSVITNYKIYRAEDQGGESLLTTIGNLLSYHDTAVINLHTYTYRVSAVNAIGEGVKSNSISLMPQDPASLVQPTTKQSCEKGKGMVTTVYGIIPVVLFVGIFLLFSSKGVGGIIPIIIGIITAASWIVIGGMVVGNLYGAIPCI
jgi:hypothetical protein